MAPPVHVCRDFTLIINHEDWAQKCVIRRLPFDPTLDLELYETVAQFRYHEF